MGNKLRALGNASAGRKEENMFRLFAYLNTRGDFSPTVLKDKVSVTPKTVWRYLSDIQKAQMLTKEYTERLEKDFSEHWFSVSQGLQLEIAKEQFIKWQESLQGISELKSENKQQLLQFVFNANQFNNLDVLYQRLEQSLLLYAYINAPKKMKGLS